MALAQKKISKAKQIRLAATLILVIGTTLAVAYFAFLKKPSFEDPKAQKSLQDAQISLSIPQQTGLDAIRELKNSEFFTQLRSFGIWPLSIEPKGRSQLFILNKDQ